MGHMVLHHHAGGPCVDGDPPTPPTPRCIFYGCSVARIPLDSVRGVDIATQQWAQLSGMEGVGHAVLHHHAGGPCVDGDPPTPPTPRCIFYGCSVARIPLDSVRGVDIATQQWAQLSGMEGVGHAVLHHHAGGPCVYGDPPATAPMIYLLRIAWMGECHCVAHSPP